MGIDIKISLEATGQSVYENKSLNYEELYSNGVLVQYAFGQDAQVIRNGDIVAFVAEQTFDISSVRNYFLTYTTSENNLKKLLDICRGLIGGFIVTVINTATKEIILIRDKTGLYSLYFARNGGVFQVSDDFSRLKNFVKPTTINLNGLNEQLAFRWNSATDTLLEGVFQVPAGHYVELSNSKFFNITAYWRLDNDGLTVGKKPLNEIEKNVDLALSQYFDLARKRYSKICISLSGGVDSALLAAKAAEKFDDCLCVTPVFKEGDNLELEAACYFAKKLGIKHELAELSRDDIINNYNAILEESAGLPRHYSSIPFRHTLHYAAKKGYPAIVYGELADTLFGTNIISRVVQRIAKKKRIGILPHYMRHLTYLLGNRFANKASKLQNTSFKDMLVEDLKIEYERCDIKQAIPILNDAEDVNLNLFQLYEVNSEKSIEAASKDELLMLIKALLYATIVADCFTIVGKMKPPDLHILVPFIFDPIVKESFHIPFKEYSHNPVKKVIKNIACRYFDKEFVFGKKYGFPTPHIDWLTTVFKDKVSRIQNNGYLVSKGYIDSNYINKFSVRENPELFWGLMAFEEKANMLQLL